MLPGCVTSGKYVNLSELPFLMDEMEPLRMLLSEAQEQVQIRGGGRQSGTRGEGHHWVGTVGRSVVSILTDLITVYVRPFLRMDAPRPPGTPPAALRGAPGPSEGVLGGVLTAGEEGPTEGYVSGRVPSPVKRGHTSLLRVVGG